MTQTSTLTRSGAPSVKAARWTGLLQGRCGMTASLVVGSAVFGLVLLLSTAVCFAQSAQGLFWQCVPADASHPQPQYCPVGAAYGLPGGPAVNGLLPVTGTQRGLAISSATGLTVPTGAKAALIQAQGTNTTGGVCLFWQDDGTAPTGTAGQALAANTSIWVGASSIGKIELIAATGATCTATISYYK